jgi:hypothetical protein
MGKRQEKNQEGSKNKLARKHIITPIRTIACKAVSTDYKHLFYLFHYIVMSTPERLTSEMEALFEHTDSDGLLDKEDLEEAGFSYREEIDNLEIWENGKTIIEYRPEERKLEDYTIHRH